MEGPALRSPRTAVDLLEAHERGGVGLGDLAAVVEREKLLEAAEKEAAPEPRHGHTMDAVENLGGTAGPTLLHLSSQPQLF